MFKLIRRFLADHLRWSFGVRSAPLYQKCLSFWADPPAGGEAKNLFIVSKLFGYKW